MEIPEGEEKEKGTESVSEAIMAENFPNVGREMDISDPLGPKVPKEVECK